MKLISKKALIYAVFFFGLYFFCGLCFKDTLLSQADNLAFNADSKRVVYELQTNESPKRIQLHPMFNLIISPAAKVLINTLGKDIGLITLNAMVGALSVFFMYHIILSFLLTPVFTFLLTCLFGFSACQLFFSIAPETHQFAGLGILCTYYFYRYAHINFQTKQKRNRGFLLQNIFAAFTIGMSAFAGLFILILIFADKKQKRCVNLLFITLLVFLGMSVNLKNLGDTSDIPDIQLSSLAHDQSDVSYRLIRLPHFFITNIISAGIRQRDTQHPISWASPHEKLPIIDYESIFYRITTYRLLLYILYLFFLIRGIYIFFMQKKHKQDAKTMSIYFLISMLFFIIFAESPFLFSPLYTLPVFLCIMHGFTGIEKKENRIYTALFVLMIFLLVYNNITVIRNIYEIYRPLPV